MDWMESHENECQVNHEGSSGKREVIAILDMFKRSENEYGIQYKYYIEDGDSKTFKQILDEDLYSEGYQVIKKRVRGTRAKKNGHSTA